MRQRIRCVCVDVHACVRHRNVRHCVWCEQTFDFDWHVSCSAALLSICRVVLQIRVYFKRGFQPKCGVQDEKCGVQNWKMCSPKQHLYTSRNSLFWALTHSFKFNTNLYLHSSSFQNPHRGPYSIVFFSCIYFWAPRLGGPQELGPQVHWTAWTPDFYATDHATS